METAPDKKLSWEYTEEAVADSLPAGDLAEGYEYHFIRADVLLLLHDP
jgi:hypothetical protein